MNFWQSFRNHFVTAQLIVGLYTAAIVGVQAWRRDGLLGSIAWGIGAFICVMPLVALICLAKAALDHRRLQRQQQSPSRQ